MEHPHKIANNYSEPLPWIYDISMEDTNWIITSSFMIFTMQTGKLILVNITKIIFYFNVFSMYVILGFGMLESGCVSIKNEVNIMMKNVVDIVLGGNGSLKLLFINRPVYVAGLTYWIFGFAFSFGRSPLNNPFIAFGDFFVDPSIDDPLKGAMYAAFLFQMSFATTATTIVSGAMAERYRPTK